MTEEPLLRIESATRRFGGVTAVDGVDLELERGEAVAVIGPNGAGKSTLLRLIAGQDRPTGGRIYLHGSRRIDTTPAHRVAHLGVALARQVPRPLHRLSVRDNLLIGSQAGRARRTTGEKAHVEDTLELTGLRGKAEMTSGRLQLLDLKRLELARALAMSPDLLLLDEVGAGLSDRELDVMIELVRRVHESGTTLLLVEHIPAVVHALAQRVIVLDWGQEIAAGTPAEIAANEVVQEVYLGRPAEAGGKERGRARPVANGAGAGDPLLALEGVSAGYGGSLALDDVSLEVTAGEVVTVLGPNGSGKSTLAAAASGLLKPQSGSIRWEGREVTRTPTHERVRLGLVHCQEGRKIFEGLSVGENLDLGAYRASPAETRQRRREVHQIFPILADRAKQEGSTLSGGQQQMLAIGRALMAAPRVLLLDEVALGLAPKAADEIYDALERIRDAGVAMVLIEQSSQRSQPMADRALVLERGRIAYSGAAGDLQPETLTRIYLAGSNDLSNERGALSR